MNKWDDITDYISDHRLDLVGVTETWIPPSLSDLPFMLPAGFSIISLPRPSRRGGGIALIHRDSFIIEKQTPVNATTFECLEVTIRMLSSCIRLIIVYSPPPSKQNGFTVNQFLTEFENLLEQHSVSAGKLVIIGDFNFQWDNSQNTDTSKIRSLIDSYNLTQHVSDSTHTSGHTLD